MDTNALVKNFDDVPGESWATAATIEVRADEAGAARSEENILQWMAYLPEDCIRAMIAMGWDVTT
jgi:hypothetical protein